MHLDKNILSYQIVAAAKFGAFQEVLLVGAIKRFYSLVECYREG